MEDLRAVATLHVRSFALDDTDTQIDGLEALLESIRSQALEEAAKECLEEQKTRRFQLAADMAAGACARRIRALKKTDSARGDQTEEHGVSDT